MKNLQKGFVIPLVIGIIVILAIGGGVYYSKVKKVPDSQENVSVNNHPDWKTYSNNDGTFQISYPASWTAQAGNQPGDSVVTNNGVTLSRDGYMVSIAEDSAGNNPNGCGYRITDFAPGQDLTDEHVVYDNEVLPGVKIGRGVYSSGPTSQYVNYFPIMICVFKDNVNTKTFLTKNNKEYPILLIPPLSVMQREGDKNKLVYADKEIISEADEIISTFTFTK